MCFDRNINGNRDVKFLECDYLLVQRCVKLTSPIYQVELSITSSHKIPNFLFGMLKLILKYFEFCIPNIFFSLQPKSC